MDEPLDTPTVSPLRRVFRTIELFGTDEAAPALWIVLVVAAVVATWDRVDRESSVAIAAYSIAAFSVVAALYMLVKSIAWTYGYVGSDRYGASISNPRAQRLSEPLANEVRDMEQRVATLNEEERRLSQLIEHYRDTAKDEFRYAATDLLGEEAAATVANEYLSWARALWRRHNRARAWSIAILTAGAGLVAALLLVNAGSPFDAQRVLAKVAITIPVAFLYGALAHEASEYRREALIATNIGVQMRSVAAYTMWLDVEDKSGVRARLGKEIFGGPPKHLIPAGSDGARGELSVEFLMQVLRGLVPGTPNPPPH